MPGPGTPDGRREKKAPAAKGTSSAKKASAGPSTPAKKSVPGRPPAPPSSTPRAKKAAPRKAAPAASPSTAAKRAVSTNGGSKAPKDAPRKAPSPARSKTPSEREVLDSRFFKRAKKRAEKVFSDPEKMRGIAAEASDKSKGARSGQLSEILDEISALIRLVVAYARGTYRDVSGQTMVIILAGLIYFVSPVDLIPDFIPVAGYVDDLAVLGWVIRTVRDELEAFMGWETGQEK